MKKIIQNENGFSLIEVMVALLILLFGMLGVMGMQYMAVQGNSANRTFQVASNYAFDLVEQVEAGGMTAGTYNPTDTEKQLTGGIAYLRRLWIEPNCVSLSTTDGTCTATSSCTVAANADAGASAVRVRTCWTDGNGVAHAITFDTIEAL